MINKLKLIWLVLTIKNVIIIDQDELDNQMKGFSDAMDDYQAAEDTQ